ncbi:MAG TPA: hypothetical protein VJ249_03835 [Candidatus Bathyarchaeia archaeon]|nr:hypothetical protein [Candidatus Bathyarchaeia archaeon]
MTEEIPETIVFIIKHSRRMLLEAFSEWLETNKEAIGEKSYDSLNSTRRGGDWRDCDTIGGIMGTAMWLFNMVANLGVLAGMGPGNYQIHQIADDLDEKTTKRLLMAISTSLNLQYIPRDLVKDFKLPIITSKKFSLKAYVQENP